MSNTCAWDAVRYSGAYAWLGVEVFFGISGFIIPTRFSPQTTACLSSTASWQGVSCGLNRLYRQHPDNHRTVAPVGNGAGL
jgi:hypothetical protein